MTRGDYPNLAALLEGRVSGTFSEWPQIKNEVSKLFAECEKLEKAIKKHKSLRREKGMLWSSVDEELYKALRE